MQRILTRLGLSLAFISLTSVAYVHATPSVVVMLFGTLFFGALMVMLLGISILMNAELEELEKKAKAFKVPHSISSR